jgi:hypothetical protein
MKNVLAMFVVAGFAAAASAQIGSPNDLYVFGDGSDNVYQVETNGTFVGNFSSTGRGNTHGVFGGPSNNFLAGGFGGIKEIDGNTGAVVRTIDGGNFFYGVQFANNGNIYGSTGTYGGAGVINEYDYTTGNYVRTVVSGIGGWSAFVVRQNDMYTVDDRSTWFDGSIITKRDAVTGAAVQSWNLGGFTAIQAVRFDSFGNLYFASMYDARNAIFKLDMTTGTASLFADSDVPGGAAAGYPGCHGFNFGNDGALYAAMAGGTVAKYDGITGAFLGTVFTVNDKLSDVVMKPVPAPGALALLGLGALVSRRRRR